MKDLQANKMHHSLWRTDFIKPFLLLIKIVNETIKSKQNA